MSALPPAPPLDATALAQAIASGRLSARAVVDGCIAQVEATHARVNAMVARRYEAARAEADAVDRARADGEVLGPLAGVPVVIKETLAVAGLPMTGGWVARKGRVSDEDEPHVARLRAAGAIVLGVTNVSQGLFFLETDNPVYGRTAHPADPDRSPGGSSGGQAALIALGAAALGLGSDLGGSIRVPAAVCGIVGLKPTAGRLPDRGTLSMPLGQTAIPSQVGIHARTVRDVARTLEALEGRPLPLPAVAGLRVGMWTDDGLFTPAAAVVRGVRLAADHLRAAGVEVVDFRLPDLEEGYRLFGASFAGDGGAWVGRLAEGGPVDPRLAAFVQGAGLPRWLHPPVLGLFRLSGRRKLADLVANYGRTSGADVWARAEALDAWQARCRAAMAPFDAVLCPGFALPAVRHGATAELITAGTYTSTFNTLGWPAGVVPTTRVRPDEERATPRGSDVMDRTAAATELGSAGLPVSAQIAARPGRDDLVLALLAAIEAGG